MTAILIGKCCCRPVEYNSLDMVLRHTLGPPTTPITSGTLTLYYYEQFSTHETDITFDLDISPIEGKTVSEIWDQDWTFKLLENGEEAGRVIYHFVRGESSSTFFVNITVYYAGYVFRAEDCNTQEAPMSGLTVSRHSCTQESVPRQ